MKEKRSKRENEVSNQEAYDFFTGVWEEEVEVVVKEDKKAKRNLQKQVSTSKGSEEESDEEDEDEDEYETANEGEEDEEGGEGEGDKKKLLASHYIGREYDWEVTEWKGPEILDPGAREAAEAEVYYTPSGFPPAGEQLQEVVVERVDRAGEGLYTGQLPRVGEGNLHRMENRVLQEAKHRPESRGATRPAWFTPGGELSRMAAPLGRQAVRPGEEEGEPLTHWVPAVPASAEQNLIGGALGLAGAGRGCQLEVDLASLVFRHHHLFSLEHYMTRRLMELYHEYSTRLRNNTVASLTSRLHTLYQETSKVEELMITAKEDEIQFQKKRLNSYRTEIKALRAERDGVSRFEKDLVKSILASWKDLRDVRKKQSFTITGHKLAIHKESANVEEDKRNWK